MKPRQIVIFGGLLVIVLVAADLCSYWVMTIAKDEASIGLRDAAVCQRLADQIVVLKTKPAIANTAEEAQETLSARIESIANRFGITGDNLASIDPAPAIRVADTVYLEKPTVVQFRQITLTQLINLLCQLSGDGNGLQIKALRLSTPPQSQNNASWSAELTVTYLIYSPPQEQRASGDSVPNQW